MQWSSTGWSAKSLLEVQARLISIMPRVSDSLRSSSCPLLVRIISLKICTTQHLYSLLLLPLCIRLEELPSLLRSLKTLPTSSIESVAMSGCLKTSPRRPRTSWDLRYLQGWRWSQSGDTETGSPATLVHPHSGVQLVHLTSGYQLRLPFCNQQLFISRSSPKIK